MGQEYWTISIDTGGTFTDSVARADDGKMLVAKVPSTPDDPGHALMHSIEVLAEQGLDVNNVHIICHGTTIATNAILTSQFSKVALLTTSGFRDVLAIRNGTRPDIYNLRVPRPTEMVTRENRIEVQERITRGGEVLKILSDVEIDRVIDELRKIQPEAIAICLLFSYSNDDHEARLATKVREAFPNLSVSVSSEVVREFREYPRTSTTVINAGLRPIVGSYLEKAQKSLIESGISAPFLVMQSNGGCAVATRSASDAHRLVLSGPAGGAAGLIQLAKQHEISKVIGLDMGGTSTDICLIKDGLLPLQSSQTVNDHTLLAPSVDIHTIGSGGGSIAYADITGRLKVGPISAKAVPGPAAYLRGGTQATLTDAHVVLGTLGSSNLASDLTLDKDAALKVITELANKLGRDVTETALAIVSLSVAQMVRALRRVSVERGLDPREFTLVPFGGAGPLHVGLLLRHLDLGRALVPNLPGLFSANGLLTAGVRLDAAQTLLTPFTVNDIESYVSWFAANGSELAEKLASDGVAQNQITFETAIDARYLGQGYELTIPLIPTATGIADLPELFHKAHFDLYGHFSVDQPIEVVTLRTSAKGAFPEIKPVPLEIGNRSPEPQALIGIERVIFPDFADGIDTAHYHRDKLLAGNVFDGPCIVHQMDSTTAVLPGQRVTVTLLGDLMIEEVNS
jgi:N-methylhydantoinase A